MVVIVRRAGNRLHDRLQSFPAVAVLGPRQAGKTTLALAIAEQFPKRSVYVDLELPSDRGKLADPELYFAAREHELVILDEIHCIPGLFEILRGVIDRRRGKGIRAGQFLLLGSASMELLKQSAESLVGRISFLELTPFHALEVDAPDLPQQEKLWIRGGFPDSYLAPAEEASFEWRAAFIQTYLERDIPALGPRLPGETIRRLWQMLANQQGQMVNAMRIASSLAVSGQTVARYLDILVDLLLVRRLEPWTPNLTKRLVKSPKIYVRDSGIVHALLGLRGSEQLLGHPVAGASWEGFVIENLIAAARPGINAYFYRSSQGAEIDLLLEIRSGEVWAIEVKRSLANPRPAKGFYIACDDVKAARRIVVYPGQESYALDKDTTVMSILDAMNAVQAAV